MSAYTVSRLALDAGVSVHIVRDYEARYTRLRPWRSWLTRPAWANSLR